jgi:hypothetical protein
MQGIEARFLSRIFRSITALPTEIFRLHGRGYDDGKLNVVIAASAQIRGSCVTLVPLGTAAGSYAVPLLKYESR